MYGTADSEQLFFHVFVDFEFNIGLLWQFFIVVEMDSFENGFCDSEFRPLGGDAFGAAILDRPSKIDYGSFVKFLLFLRIESTNHINKLAAIFE